MRLTPRWSAIVCSVTRPMVLLSLPACSYLRAPVRALPVVVALRRRPGVAVRSRASCAFAGLLGPFRRVVRRGRREVRCALLGPPESVLARLEASTCQLHFL